jgi:hypothetical protein
MTGDTVLNYRTICPACGLRLSRLHCWHWGRDCCEHCHVGIRINRNRSWAVTAACAVVVLAGSPGLLLAGVTWWQLMMGSAFLSGLLLVLLPYVMLYDRTTEGVQCQGCGYDLHGITSSRCPECGHAPNA